MSSAKTYFFGEFGCLNYCVLGYLEEFQPELIMHTQPDFFKLMKLKCPRLEYDTPPVFRESLKASGFGLTVTDRHINDLESRGFVSFHQHFGFPEKRCRNYIKPIKTPLTYDWGLPKNQRYVSISFRNRAHEPNRNLPDDDWGKVLATIRKYTSLPLIAHGMSVDTKTFPDCHVTTSIEESIAYMNQSDVFIASMSGIAQFASNCACGIIQIGDVSRHIEYDPFDKGAIAVAPHDFERALLEFLK